MLRLTASISSIGAATLLGAIASAGGTLSRVQSSQVRHKGLAMDS